MRVGCADGLADAAVTCAEGLAVRMSSDFNISRSMRCELCVLAGGGELQMPDDKDNSDMRS